MYLLRLHNHEQKSMSHSFRVVTIPTTVNFELGKTLVQRIGQVTNLMHIGLSPNYTFRQ